MYSIKLGNPLQSKVEAIVAKKATYGSVNHSAFDSIRNKSSVCAVLISLGFKPCNEIRPYVWSLPNSRAQSIVKPKREMSTKTGQQVLDHLKAKGIYYVDDFKLSRKYLVVIMTGIRGLGYDVETIREGYTLVAYKLNRQ